jgi:hypothetical protein
MIGLTVEHPITGGRVMSQIPPKQQSLLDEIPTPRTIRQRLGEMLREARLLRSMLRLAERAEREREHNGSEVRHAG